MTTELAQGDVFLLSKKFLYLNENFGLTLLKPVLFEYNKKRKTINLVSSTGTLSHIFLLQS